MIKKIWNDPVWSKVISVGIIGLIATLSALIPNLWLSIGTIAKKLAASLTEDVTVPFYVLLLLGIGSALIVLMILIAIKDRLTSPPSSFLNYKSDTFFGLIWRWRYNETTGNKVSNLTSYCAKCDYQVYGAFRSDAFKAKMAYHCDSCGEDVAYIELNDQTVENRVERFILQKIRQKYTS